jgi:UDP-N-acetylmuramoyl-L-alanyl-D-glutamate--2,6-diaminopimelate ligase
VKLLHLLKDVDVLDIAGDPEGEVFSVCYDSKRCVKSALFVAVSGLVRDGHDYISEAVERGAGFVVHEKDFNAPEGITAVKVKNARRALGILAKNFYGHPSSRLCLVGVMGTNGKTTATYLLEAILQAAGHITGVMGTVNYRYRDKVLTAPNTTPESLEMQKILSEMVGEGVSHVIAEISSHAVDLGRVDDCDFDLGIFTNLSRDHLDYHKTMENYFQAKLRFFKEVLPAGGKRRQYKVAVNGDDPWGRRIQKETTSPIITFGTGAANDVRAEDVSLSLNGIRTNIQGRYGSLPLSSPLIGIFNLYNMLTAAAAAFALDVPGRFIQEGIAGLSCVPGRLERVRAGEYPPVFVDYAHTDAALEGVLRSLSDLKKGRIISVFGCGGNRDRGKRPLMGRAAVNYSDVAIVTSDNPRGEEPLEIISEIEQGMGIEGVKKLLPEEIATGITGKCYTVVPDRKQAIYLAVRIAGPDDMVLIAGKGHEDYQIIGDKRLPFDDRLVAGEALDSRRNA